MFGSKRCIKKHRGVYALAKAARVGVMEARLQSISVSMDRLCLKTYKIAQYAEDRPPYRQVSHVLLSQLRYI